MKGCEGFPGTLDRIVDVLVSALKPVWAVLVLMVVHAVQTVLVVRILAALEDRGVPAPF